MIFQFLILNCTSSDSMVSINLPIFTSLGLKFTVKIQLSLSNLCDETPFSSSRALPILFGHPNQRNPLRISIPSTSKVAVFIFLSLFGLPANQHNAISSSFFIQESREYSCPISLELQMGFYNHPF